MTPTHNRWKNADLNLLTVFDALWTERNVSRAAQKLGMSQSGMSRALGRLREYFSDELFLPGQGGLAPTARADMLSEPIQRVLMTIDESILNVEPFEPAVTRRDLVVATADYCEAILLAPLMAELVKTAPGITVRAVATRPRDVQAAIDGDVDLVIALSPEPRAGIRSTTLLHEPFVSLVRQDHPEIERLATDLELWCSLPHIAVAPHGRPGSPVDDALAARGLTRRVSSYVQSFLAAPIVASEANAITILPASIAQRVGQKYEMMTLPLPLEVPGFNLVMSWYERWHNDPGHQWFRKQVAKMAQKVEKSLAPQRDAPPALARANPT